MPGAIALAPSGNDDGLLTSSEILDLKLSNAALWAVTLPPRGRRYGASIILIQTSSSTTSPPFVNILCRSKMLIIFSR